MAEMKVDSADVRRVLDAAVEMGLAHSGGDIRKRLKQLKKALAKHDAAQARRRAVQPLAFRLQPGNPSVQYFCATCSAAEGVEHKDFCHRSGVMKR